MEQKGRPNRMDSEDAAGREARRALQDYLRRAAMGEIRAKVRLENAGDAEAAAAGRIPKESVRAREIEAVVDTGAVMTLMPQDLVEDLGLRILGRHVVVLADDRKIELPSAGGIQLWIGDRLMITDCLVGPPGCEPLIGQLVMERLDLIADPARRTLTVRPESPLRPTLKMKTAFLFN